MQLRDEFWDTAPHYGGRKGSPVSKYFLPVLKIFMVH